MAQDTDEALRSSRLAARLAQYPELRARFEEILAVAENERGDANTADEAEERAARAGAAQEAAGRGGVAARDPRLPERHPRGRTPARLAADEGERTRGEAV